MRGKCRHAKKGRAGTRSAAPSSLPEELWQHILSRLSATDRINAAAACSSLAAASFAGMSRVAVDLRNRVGERLPLGLKELLVLYGTDPAQLSAVVAALEAEIVDQGDFVASRSRHVGSAMSAGLRRLVKALPAIRPGAARSPLALTLAVPGALIAPQQLQALLEGGNGDRITEVNLARGLAALDGALQDRLVRANVLGATLVPWLKVGAYRRLSSVSAKVHSSGELSALLASITQDSLPALHTLVLVAQQGAGCRAAFGALRHAGLQRLVLHGVEAEGGFEGLEQLEGLESLSLCYDEDEGPEVNLEGNLHLLSSLRQLRRLKATNLVCDEGLPALTHLTSLAIAPSCDTYIAVEHLPNLQHLAVDLTAECRGMELLERGCVVCLPKGHGLRSLRHVELRSLVWQPGQGAGAAGAWHSGGESGAAGVFSAGSNPLQGGALGSDSDSDQGLGEQPWGPAGHAGLGQPGEGDNSEGWDEGDAGSMGSNSDVEEEEEGDEGASASASEDEDGDAGSEPVGEGEEGEEELAAGEGEEEGAELAPEGAGGSELGATLADEGGGAAYAVALPQWAQQGSEEADAKAAALLESWYIAGLVRRIPTLASILLSDYMGPIPGASTCENAQIERGGGSAPRTIGTRAAAARVAAAASAGAGAAQASGAGGDGKRLRATLCDIAGAAWERSVCETPVPGGISQIDLRYTKLG